MLISDEPRDLPALQLLYCRHRRRDVELGPLISRRNLSFIKSSSLFDTAAMRRVDPPHRSGRANAMAPGKKYTGKKDGCRGSNGNALRNIAVCETERKR